MSLISLKNIVKTYNPNTDISLTVLHDISLDIDNGEFVAIMGPSGSGKSTLMHLIGFLDTATSGQYIFENEDITHFSESNLAAIRNRSIGFVFQAFHLLPRTSAVENVSLPLLYSGVSEAERYAKAKEMLTLVGLAERLDHTPAELSGGQQQRVSIARALINNPSIILADEPTGNLDSKSSVDIMQFLTTLNKQGKTIILVTHEPDIAEYAKRIITVQDGYIKSDIRK